jgi:two-component system sensor kinase FixL
VTGHLLAGEQVIARVPPQGRCTPGLSATGLLFQQNRRLAACGSLRDVDFESLLLSYPGKGKRLPWLVLGGVSVAAIALVDWLVTPNVSIGTFYLLPIVLAAPILNRWQIAALAAGCSILREVFAPFVGEPGAILRISTTFLGFVVVGLAVSELHRSRRLAVQLASERQRAEAELKAIVETTPLAILVLDEGGRILQANQSAHRVLAARSGALIGESLERLVPVPLYVNGPGGPAIRTRLECRAQRCNGEPFFAHVWMAGYAVGEGSRTAVVIWDGSDDLRDREGVGTESLMATSRILLGAISHELRNFVAAARNSVARIQPAIGEAAAEDAERLGAALVGLEAAAHSGLRLAADRPTGTADLGTVLDEAWIIMEPGFREAEIEVVWHTEKDLPRVRGDQTGLVQVLINLLRNSEAALENAENKKVFVVAALVDGQVRLRITDTGPGVRHPESLFRVFPAGAHTGLGLYLSRSIVLSFGGDLRYEPGAAGACFVVELRPVPVE